MEYPGGHGVGFPLLKLSGSTTSGSGTSEFCDFSQINGNSWAQLMSLKKEEKLILALILIDIIHVTYFQNALLLRQLK